MAEHIPTTSPEARARKRLKDYNGLLWHAVTFVVVNLFLWFLDLLPGDGIDWAYWTTIPWGIGMAFHAAAYWIGDDDDLNPRYERYLEEERQRHQVM